MNFQSLFTTSRVVVALYRTVSTTVLLYYLVKRMKEKRPPRDRVLNRY
jgi:hypothetical protein